MKKIALAACVSMLLATGLAISQDAVPGNPTNTGFVGQQAGDRFASRLVGLNIQNTADENIGEIYDIVLTEAGAVRAYIVSVGGFLGIGEKSVAIEFPKLSWVEANGDRWLVTDASKEQLEALPDFDRSPYEPATPPTASPSDPGYGAAGPAKPSGSADRPGVADAIGRRAGASRPEGGNWLKSSSAGIEASGPPR